MCSSIEKSLIIACTDYIALYFRLGPRPTKNRYAQGVNVCKLYLITFSSGQVRTFVLLVAKKFVPPVYTFTSYNKHQIYIHTVVTGLAAPIAISGDWPLDLGSLKNANNKLNCKTSVGGAAG